MGKESNLYPTDIGRKRDPETKREELQRQLIHLPQKMAGYGNAI